MSKTVDSGTGAVPRSREHMDSYEACVEFIRGSCDRRACRHLHLDAKALAEVRALIQAYPLACVSHVVAGTLAEGVHVPAAACAAGCGGGKARHPPAKSSTPYERMAQRWFPGSVSSVVAVATSAPEEPAVPCRGAVPRSREEMDGLSLCWDLIVSEQGCRRLQCHYLHLDAPALAEARSLLHSNPSACVKYIVAGTAPDPRVHPPGRPTGAHPACACKAGCTGDKRHPPIHTPETIYARMARRAFPPAPAAAAAAADDGAGSAPPSARAAPAPAPPALLTRVLSAGVGADGRRADRAGGGLPRPGGGRAAQL